MAKVIATSRGYYGGIVRDPGDSFSVPDDIWSDPKRRPRWAKLDPRSVFGGKGDHDGDGSVGGSKPKGGGDGDGGSASAVTVPADWQNLKAAERKALAVKISGAPVKNVGDADKIVEAHAEASKPAAFDDAPEPTVVEGNGVKEALGTEPDWIPPGGNPQPVND